MTSSDELQSILLGIEEPDEEGARGLLEAVTKSLDRYDAPKAVGLITDDEAAKSVRHQGLWTRMRALLDRDILTFWCICHRSDLALESVEHSVSELRHWKADILAVTRCFRTRKSRSKLLLSHLEQMHHFPEHFEVRFAQNPNQIIEAVLHNLSGCCLAWKEVAKSNEYRPKAEANGFLKKWNRSQFAINLTALMSDVTAVFQWLQKRLQQGDLILPDVLEARNSAIRQLTLMLSGPSPGGLEEKFFVSEDHTPMRAHNSCHPTAQLWCCSQRNSPGSCKVFGTASAWRTRRNCEHGDSSDKCFDTGRFFRNWSQDFSERKVLKSFAKKYVIRGQLCLRLVIIVFIRWAKSCGPFMMRPQSKQKIVWSFSLVDSPQHGYGKVVSHFNTIRSPQWMSTKGVTANDRLVIAENGAATVNFDPRPAVARFFTKRQHRQRTPNNDSYQNREVLSRRWWHLTCSSFLCSSSLINNSIFKDFVSLSKKF